MGQVSQAPRCKCGTIKSYDMDRGSYKCNTCLASANSMAVQQAELKPVLGSTAPKRVEIPLEELEEALRASAETARKVTVFDCKSCGAQVETPLSQEICECVFCGRKTVNSEKTSQNHSCQVLVPFRISQDEAVEQMKKHLSTLWLRPSGLGSEITVERVRKVYLPFWCYDVKVDTEWSGTTQVFEEPGFFGKLFGKEGRYRKIPVSGFRSAEYDDWLVCGSKALEPKILRKLEPFDTEGASLRPLDDDLQGVALEVGTTSPRLGWAQAQVEIRARECELSQGEAEVQAGHSGGSEVDVKGIVKFGVPLAKAAVLPVYMFSHTTAYGSCKVVVNGESGTAGAIVPYSYPKLLPVLFLLLMAFFIATVVSGGLAVPALGAYFLYKWWKGKGTVEQKAARFPAR